MAAQQLIIFDCDGVLVDSEPLAAEAYERVYEKHGMSGVGADIIAQCVGMKQADIIIRIKELNVFSLCFFEAEIAGGGHAGIGFVNDPDSGILRRVFIQDFTAGIL